MQLGKSHSEDKHHSRRYNTAQAASLDWTDLQTIVPRAGSGSGAAAAAVKLDRRGKLSAAACRRQAIMVHGVVRACARAAAVLLPVAGL